MEAPLDSDDNEENVEQDDNSNVANMDEDDFGVDEGNPPVNQNPVDGDENAGVDDNEDEGDGDGEGLDDDDGDGDGDGDEDNNRNNDAIDGGVVKGCKEKKSADCAMILLIECKEELPTSIVAPDHPIYRKGVTVQIGLEKTTKLSAVFARYCEFANSYQKGNGVTPNMKRHKITKVETTDLNFYHCSLLKGSETAESNALMKNDCISARPSQSYNRQQKVDAAIAQRESDRDFFNQMRFLLPGLSPSSIVKCDTTFHCQGKIKDGNGFKQDVLTPFVKAHGGILSKRCKWLGYLIRKARMEKMETENGMSVIEDTSFHQRSISRIFGGHNNVEEEDDGILPAPFQPDCNEECKVNNFVRVGHGEGGRRGIEQPAKMQANAVEDDEDDDSFNLINLNRNASSSSVAEIIRSDSPVPVVTNSDSSNTIIVPLIHPPEAVKLLLEYCYTNRVISLGSEAFHTSSLLPDLHTIDPMLQPHIGPVSPYNSTRGGRSSWPNGGLPTVSIQVALAGVQLAEEAQLPRLSLMCEVAASRLVCDTMLLESLALCEAQSRTTGNDLPLLRKAVMMHHILARGRRGVGDLAAMPSFQRIMEDRRQLVMPSLLKGVSEVMKIGMATVKGNNNGKKDGGGEKDGGEKKVDADEMNRLYFKSLDEEDIRNRSFERELRRKESLSMPSNFFSSTANKDMDECENCSTIIFNDDGGVINDLGTNVKPLWVRYSKTHHVGSGRRIYEFRDTHNVPPANSSVITRKSASRSRKRGR